MKHCIKCGKQKPLDQFYAAPSMADGYLGKCKSCYCLDVAANTAKKRQDPVWAAKERERCRQKAAKARANGKGKSSPLAGKMWCKKNPIKKHAHSVAWSALRRGKITKPTACTNCHQVARLEMHHHDYAKPLDVQWLCIPCHGLTRHKDNPLKIAA